MGDTACATTPGSADATASDPQRASVCASPSSAHVQHASHRGDHGVDAGTDDTTAEDRVRWPINRLSYEELKPHELATVEKLFAARDDAPLLIKWVLLHRSGKFRKRLVVVSPFRLWLLQRKKPFKTQLVCAKELQLLHIQRINVLQSAAAASATSPTMSIELLVSEPPSMATAASALHFDPGAHTESFVRLFQRLLHALRLAFPDKLFPRVALPRQCHWREFFPTSADAQCPEDRGALLAATTTAYRAFCDDLRIPYRASVTARLAECAGASVDFQYCLAFPPGVDGYQQHALPFSLKRHVTELLAAASTAGLSSSSSAVAIQLREVQALARTLEHCHCFDGVMVYDLAMNDVGLRALFQALLSPFSRIHALALTNVQLSARALRILQHVVLQSTLKRTHATQQHQQQQTLQLRRLDFSGNAFSQPMAHELATIFALLPSGLDALELEQCALSAASSAHVLRAIKTNTSFAASLRELNVAGNRLSLDGTDVLASWLATAFALHRLDVSQTDAEMNVLMHALRLNSLLHESSLRVLDVSYNRMRTQASDDLGYILGTTQSLSTLFVRGMQRTFSALEALQAPLRTALSGLKPAHLTSILAPMFRNTGRALPCLVDLSENDLSGATASLLAQLIDASPIVGRASLRLDHTHLHDRSSILLLHAVRGCRTLRSLSLEGNGYVKRRTARSRQRFHAASSTPSASSAAALELSPPSALEVAAANVFALLLGGPSSASPVDALSGAQGHAADEARAPHADVRVSSSSSSAAPLPLKELSLKSESPMLFGAHVITAAVNALALNQSLQVLDVSGNECGDALAQCLGTVLRVNRRLEVLFWDGNFTTVDGFVRFYDGLALNRTLVMVQMPIQDTRRILEEMKDPPREQLFSVLGKIFKATERNQRLARSRTKAHQRARTRQAAHECSAQTPLPTRSANQQEQELEHEIYRCGESESPEDASVKAACDRDSSNSSSSDSHQIDDEYAHETKALSLEPASLRLATSEEDEDEDAGNDGYTSVWGRAVADSVRLRYPSTMHSWSRSSGNYNSSCGHALGHVNTHISISVYRVPYLNILLKIYIMYICSFAFKFQNCTM